MTKIICRFTVEVSTDGEDLRVTAAPQNKEKIPTAIAALAAAEMVRQVCARSTLGFEKTLEIVESFIYGLQK